MKDDLLQMLANFSTYMKYDFQECTSPNSANEACGCFRGENTMGNDERGVRPNADLSMVCAFLAKYGKGKVTLPAGVSWSDIEQMAMKSLVFAYSTHKANKLKVCANNAYWGSVSTSDQVWESSLWAMSVAYSAFFQWDSLSEQQKTYIYNLLKAECNYELYRSIPRRRRTDGRRTSSPPLSDSSPTIRSLRSGSTDCALSPSTPIRMRAMPRTPQSLTQNTTTRP